MKRFGLVLLLLGLWTVFSTSAFALDVKFSGEFFAGGMYLNKTSLDNDNTVTGQRQGVSTAFYFQRLRLRTDFVVSPGFTLITRLDAMERAWGATRSTPTTTLALDSTGTVAENQNIAFDWAYVDYVSPLGTFDVGYMNDGNTGTIFGDSVAPAARIKYAYSLGNLTLKAAITKVADNSYITGSGNTNTINGYSDADKDKYGVEAIYTWKSGLAGLNVNYYRYADTRPTANNKRTYYIFTPYTIAKFGPVALQAELNYATGKYTENESGLNDVKMENISGWLDVTATFGPVYFGGTFAYVSGDDPNTTDKQEGGTLTGGRDWNPTLIMFNYDREIWLGELASSATTGKGFGTSGMTNAFFYQGRIGVKPTDKLDIMASVSYANADKSPANYVSTTYGTEFDVTGTYKITNNLTYMLGFGYLLTGDYFKGTNASNTVQNDYLIINKLTLTF
jgi:hypothetical protein